MVSKMLAYYRRYPAYFVGLLLIVVTLVVYWPVHEFEFINYDDDQYITENPNVLEGLSGSGLAWSFTTFYAYNWHPLTWLSHLQRDPFTLHPDDASGLG